MNFLISFCLNNRITVILLTLALAVISIFVVKNIPVDVFPELKVPRVTIQTEAPGLTAEEVEQYITIPIESAMNGTAGVKGVRSSSGSGLSFVWVPISNSLTAPWFLGILPAFCDFRTWQRSRSTELRDAATPDSWERTPLCFPYRRFPEPIHWR